MTLKTRICRLEGRRAPSVDPTGAKSRLIRRIDVLAERMREAGAPPEPGARERVLDYLAMKFGAREEWESKLD